jgi:hypothetical protein
MRTKSIKYQKKPIAHFPFSVFSIHDKQKYNFTVHENEMKINKIWEAVVLVF